MEQVTTDDAANRSALNEQKFLQEKEAFSGQDEKLVASTNCDKLNNYETSFTKNEKMSNLVPEPVIKNDSKSTKLKELSEEDLLLMTQNLNYREQFFFEFTFLGDNETLQKVEKNSSSESQNVSSSECKMLEVDDKKTIDHQKADNALTENITKSEPLTFGDFDDEIKVLDCTKPFIIPSDNNIQHQESIELDPKCSEFVPSNKYKTNSDEDRKSTSTDNKKSCSRENLNSASVEADDKIMSNEISNISNSHEESAASSTSVNVTITVDKSQVIEDSQIDDSKITNSTKNSEEGKNNTECAISQSNDKICPTDQSTTLDQKSLNDVSSLMDKTNSTLNEELKISDNSQFHSNVLLNGESLVTDKSASSPPISQVKIDTFAEQLVAKDSTPELKLGNSTEDKKIHGDLLENGTVKIISNQESYHKNSEDRSTNKLAAESRKAIDLNTMFHMKWLHSSDNSSSAQLNLAKLPTKDERNGHYFEGNKGSSTSYRHRNKSGNNSFFNENQTVKPITNSGDQYKPESSATNEKDVEKEVHEKNSKTQNNNERPRTALKDGNMKIIDDDEDTDKEGKEKPRSNLPENMTGRHMNVGINDENTKKAFYDQFGRLDGCAEKHSFMGSGGRRKEQELLQNQENKPELKSHEGFVKAEHAIKTDNLKTTEEKETQELTKNANHPAANTTNQEKPEVFPNRGRQHRYIHGRAGRDNNFFENANQNTSNGTRQNDRYKNIIPVNKNYFEDKNRNQWQDFSMKSQEMNKNQSFCDRKQDRYGKNLSRYNRYDNNNYNYSYISDSDKDESWDKEVLVDTEKKGNDQPHLENKPKFAENNFQNQSSDQWFQDNKQRGSNNYQLRQSNQCQPDKLKNSDVSKLEQFNYTGNKSKNSEQSKNQGDSQKGLDQVSKNSDSFKQSEKQKSGRRNSKNIEEPQKQEDLKDNKAKSSETPSKQAGKKHSENKSRNSKTVKEPEVQESTESKPTAKSSDNTSKQTENQHHADQKHNNQNQQANSQQKSNNSTDENHDNYNQQINNFTESKNKSNKNKPSLNKSDQSVKGAMEQNDSKRGSNKMNRTANPTSNVSGTSSFEPREMNSNFNDNKSLPNLSINKAVEIQYVSSNFDPKTNVAMCFEGNQHVQQILGLNQNTQNTVKVSDNQQVDGSVTTVNSLSPELQNFSNQTSTTHVSENKEAKTLQNVQLRFPSIAEESESLSWQIVELTNEISHNAQNLLRQYNKVTDLSRQLSNAQADLYSMQVESKTLYEKKHVLETQTQNQFPVHGAMQPFAIGAYPHYLLQPFFNCHDNCSAQKNLPVNLSKDVNVPPGMESRFLECNMGPRSAAMQGFSNEKLSFAMENPYIVSNMPSHFYRQQQQISKLEQQQTTYFEQQLTANFQQQQQQQPQQPNFEQPKFYEQQQVPSFQQQYQFREQQYEVNSSSPRVMMPPTEANEQRPLRGSGHPFPNQ